MSVALSSPHHQSNTHELLSPFLWLEFCILPPLIPSSAHLLSLLLAPDGGLASLDLGTDPDHVKAPLPPPLPLHLLLTVARLAVSVQQDDTLEDERVIW